MNHAPGDDIPADDDQLIALKAALDHAAKEKGVWNTEFGANARHRYENFWKEVFKRGYILHIDTAEHFIDMGLPRREVETTFALLFY